MTDTIKISRERLAGLAEYADQLLHEVNGLLNYAGSIADDRIHVDADYLAVLELLAQPSEPQGGEEVEVVAYIRFCSDGCYEGPLRKIDDVRKRSGVWSELMTVAQHRRLMAEQLERERGVVEALRVIATDDFAAGHDATDAQISAEKGRCVFRMRGAARQALAAWEKNHGK